MFPADPCPVLVQSPTSPSSCLTITPFRKHWESFSLCREHTQRAERQVLVFFSFLFFSKVLFCLQDTGKISFVNWIKMQRKKLHSLEYKSPYTYINIMHLLPYFGINPILFVLFSFYSILDFPTSHWEENMIISLVPLKCHLIYSAGKFIITHRIIAA